MIITMVKNFSIYLQSKIADSMLVNKSTFIQSWVDLSSSADLTYIIYLVLLA